MAPTCTSTPTYVCTHTCTRTFSCTCTYTYLCLCVCLLCGAVSCRVSRVVARYFLFVFRHLSSVVDCPSWCCALLFCVVACCCCCLRAQVVTLGGPLVHVTTIFLSLSSSSPSLSLTPVCGSQNASLCTFKTSPCVPAPRPMWTWCWNTLGRFECTHGESTHGVFQRATPYATTTTTHTAATTTTATVNNNTTAQQQHNKTTTQQHTTPHTPHINLMPPKTVNYVFFVA